MCNERKKICSLKGCGKPIIAKNREGFVCVGCDKKFCSCECRMQAPKCEPQLTKEQNHIDSFNNALNNWDVGNNRYTFTPEYNGEIEMHRQSLREFQGKKHHMELRLVEEENDWHGKCEYRNGWSKEKQIASIKESIAGWEAKIQYEKDWLAKNGTEQDRKDLPKNKKENAPKLPSKDLNINSLIQYFQNRNIKQISLTTEGNLLIEYYAYHNKNKNTKNNASITETITPERQESNSPEFQEVKSYLQKTNKKELSQQELINMNRANATPTEKPKNNNALWMGGVAVALVIGMVVGLLVKNRVRKIKT